MRVTVGVSVSPVDIGLRLERAPRRFPADRVHEEITRLRALVPAGSKLVGMTADDVKEELAKRD